MKPLVGYDGSPPHRVTPFVGVWIETYRSEQRRQQHRVTPFVGVWIETHNIEAAIIGILSHPSWVCGLKHDHLHRCTPASQSHPSWVCGLKPCNAGRCSGNRGSHPSWVCGLKHIAIIINLNNSMSHPSWVCGLKHDLARHKFKDRRVTPFVGVWIETVILIF